ncbi:MAG: hypothetical protein QGF00_00420, partial [Planctomycetota bacterium]|nr:hypothetical protein [Planctomycetota bacterium]
CSNTTGRPAIDSDIGFDHPHVEPLGGVQGSSEQKNEEECRLFHRRFHFALSDDNHVRLFRRSRANSRSQRDAHE